MANLSQKDALKTIAAVEKAFVAGFPPSDRASNGQIVATTEAARILGLSRNTVAARVEPNGPCWRLYGLRADVRKWKEPKVEDKKAGNPDAIDPIVLRKMSDQLTRSNARATAAERAAISAVGLREGVFRLASIPPEPPQWKSDIPTKGDPREALILPISDIHMGEVVDLQQMGGRNSYNREIARRRLERLFKSYVKLGTTHWTGEPPEVVYLVLMGDMISGNIHEELAKTNDLLSLPAVREVSECLIAGINLLLQNFNCDIRVLSIPGNHGRNTRKPEAKDFAIDSYDTLVAWNLESWFSAKKEKRVSFSAPASGDALVTIHGYTFLFTHGDRIGSKGGMGFVGPAAAISRGMQKVIQDYAAEGIAVDYVIMGHFHTALELEQGFANSSVVGPSEYSKTLRARPLPATQWMLSVSPVYGVSRRWKIQLGLPEEGNIYRIRS